MKRQTHRRDGGKKGKKKEDWKQSFRKKEKTEGVERRGKDNEPK